MPNLGGSVIENTRLSGKSDGAGEFGLGVLLVRVALSMSLVICKTWPAHVIFFLFYRKIFPKNTIKISITSDSLQAPIVLKFDLLHLFQCGSE